LRRESGSGQAFPSGDRVSEGFEEQITPTAAFSDNLDHSIPSPVGWAGFSGYRRRQTVF
jgi:hypothetical protein